MVLLQRFWRAFGRDRDWVTIATLTTPAEIENGRKMAESDPDHGDPYRLLCEWPQS